MIADGIIDVSSSDITNKLNGRIGHTHTDTQTHREIEEKKKTRNAF